MNEYAKWFFEGGWVLVTAFGSFLGWTIGYRAMLIVVPMIIMAVIGKGAV